MLMISFIVPAIFSPIDLVLPMTPPKEPDCPGQPVRRLPVPSATRLRSHAGASRNYIMPALQRRMLGFDRKAGCLGRKVDRDDSGNVGRREFISRNERYLGEPDVEVSVEIPDALLASFDQRRDLIVIMRTGNGPILETRDSVTYRFHNGGKSLQLSASFPHDHQRLHLRRGPKQRRVGMDSEKMVKLGRQFT